ncbi:MAG: polysaccharide biosynthesis tyrosine autokinase [Muribaculaceae bacterium]|nr:polysaccharide biosynthesis tyrosine autokinase [Muribaculaceae bacterium]
MDNDHINAPKQDETFDTTGLLLAFLANWKWFAICVVVALIGAFFYIVKQIPVYQIDASIYLSRDNESQQNAFTIGNNGNQMVSVKDYIDETELEVLKSLNNVIKIVDSLDLAYNYFSEGTFREIPLYENNSVVAKMDSLSLRNLKNPIDITLDPVGDGKFNIIANTTFKTDKEKKEFKDVTLPIDIQLSHGTVTLSQSPVYQEPKGKMRINIRSPRAVAKQISSSLNIQFAQNSDKIIRISLLNTVIPRGVDIIEALLDFYNRDIIEDKNRSAVQTEAFILDRLVMISGELKDVENRLQEYRQAHNITDIAAQSNLNLTLNSDYEQQLAENDAELNIIDEIERIVSSSDTYQTLPAAISNNTIAQIIESYNRKVSQLNRQLEGSTSDNPLVVSMKDELSRDKVRILQNLATTKRNINARRNSISRLKNSSAGQLAATPTVDKGLQEIFREQQVKVNIYTFLLQRREEIALQKTLATNTARLIDDPEGTRLVSPRKMNTYAMAMLIGLLIPAVIIFLRRFLFPVFADQEELERLTNVPILGEVCTTDKDETEDIVIADNVSTPIAELFRLLRNNISFTRGGAESKVILVTSTISGEGKTFIATNLAMTYALMGKKVLVIGLDLRRPMLAHRFGFSNRQGLTTYLSGQESDINKLILQTNENPNLYVLPAGPVPPNPNELLMSNSMDRAMAKLREEYDYIIIDTAPVGVISDTYLITRYSDVQLYVVRAHYTSRNSLRTLHSAVETGKMKSAYIVLNGVDIRSNAYQYRRYGSYGYYGKKGNRSYGYGYLKNSNKEK